MKNLLLTIAFTLGCLQVNAQKMSAKFLQGTWETEFHTVEFKGNNKKELKITITIKETGESIQVVKQKIHDNCLYLETYYEEGDWKALGKIIIVDNETLVEDVSSTAPGLLIYKRKTNN
jgi:hypothetical protein